MHIPHQLESTAKILTLLNKNAKIIDRAASQELQSVPTTFDIENSAESIWKDGNTQKSYQIDYNKESVKFSAFIDGVQRTNVVYWVPIDNIGILIPVVLSHIGAGISLRGADKKLKINSDLVRDKILILMPLEGMIRAGFENGSSVQELIDRGDIIDERSIQGNSSKIFGLEGGSDYRPIFCDTTFNEISRTKEEEKKTIEDAYNYVDKNDYTKINKLLIGENLYNSYKIRQRALGRVNIMRQILEMMILTKYKTGYEDTQEDYILVDGPLFFLHKWIKNYGGLTNKNEDEAEKMVLRNAVGMVKTFKSRPKNINTFREILNLNQDNYSEIMKIKDVVDVTESKHNSESFIRPHITSYVRFRLPANISPPTTLGLTRVDLHVSTFGKATFEDVQNDKENTEQMMSKIMAGVIREKWPGISQSGRMYNEVFPIEETEKMLRSKLYTFMEMNYLYSLIEMKGNS